MSDISSDAYFGGEAEQHERAGPLTTPAAAGSNGGGGGGSGIDESESESESDVLEIQEHPQRPQLPSSPPSPQPGAATEAAAALPISLQLILCKVCEGSSSFAYCLTARDRNGERHVPRLRVVKGHAHRKRSKAVLLPGQREPPPGAEDGSTEDLVLNPENMALRFRVPCELCTTLAMCSNKKHPQQERTLSDIVGDEDNDDDKHPGENARKKLPEVPRGGQRQGQDRGVKKEVREEPRSGGGKVGRADAGTAAPPQKGQKKPKRKIWEVEGKRVIMPHMVSIGDAVVLSLYLAPVTISSEPRADVPGDFAVSTDMGSMSKGGYHFAREPEVTIASVLKLRALRDVISWRHNPTKAVHPLVAAKVLHVWERHNPAEAKALDAILRRGGGGSKADKLLRFQVDDGPSSVFKASRLRAMYASRSAEVSTIMASFSQDQLRSTTTPGGECFYEHELPEHGGDADGDGEGGGSAADKVGGGAAGSGVTERACRRRNSGGEGGHPAATTTGAAAGAGAGAGAGSGRRSSPSPAPSPSSSSSAQPSSPKPRRRIRVKEVVASDGRCYPLPPCIREKGLKLQLYVSLRTHRVDGQVLHAEPSAEYSPLQRPYGRADITRENLLALRAVRDVVYRNATVHPLVAADVFEIWENLHASQPRRPDKDVVEVTGALTADGVLPRAKFTAGELRKLRGAERRAVVEGLLESQLKNPKVMAGKLDEVVAPAAAERGTKQKMKRKKPRQQAGGGGGGVAGAAAGANSAPVCEPPAAATTAAAATAASPSSASSSPSPVGGGKAEVARVPKRKKSSLSTPAAADIGAGGGGGGGGTLERSPKRRSLGEGGGGGGGSSSSNGGDRQSNPQDPTRAAKKGKGRGRKGWEEEEEEEGGQEEDVDGRGIDDNDGASEEEKEEAETQGAGREQGGGEEGQEGGGPAADRFARARRASWLRAVHENDNQLRLQQERLRKEKAMAKAAHLARSVELMKWMVDEQSGKHEGSAGPPPRR